MASYKTRKVTKKKKSLCEISMDLVISIIKLSAISLSGGSSSSSKAIRRTGQSDRDHVAVRSGTAKVTANSNSSSSFSRNVDHGRSQKIRPDIIGSKKPYSSAAKGRDPYVGNNYAIKNSHNVDKRATDFITRIRKKHQNDKFH